MKNSAYVIKRQMGYYHSRRTTKETEKMALSERSIARRSESSRKPSDYKTALIYGKATILHQKGNWTNFANCQ